MGSVYYVLYYINELVGKYFFLIISIWLYNDFIKLKVVLCKKIFGLFEFCVFMKFFVFFCIFFNFDIMIFKLVFFFDFSDFNLVLFFKRERLKCKIC